MSGREEREGTAAVSVRARAAGAAESGTVGVRRAGPRGDSDAERGAGGVDGGLAEFGFRDVGELDGAVLQAA
ncbi:hypothetical protein GCM10009677_49990 [Sphaerisporangium rubeum]